MSKSSNGVDKPSQQQSNQRRSTGPGDFNNLNSTNLIVSKSSPATKPNSKINGAEVAAPAANSTAGASPKKERAGNKAKVEASEKTNQVASIQPSRNLAKSK